MLFKSKRSLLCVGLLLFICGMIGATTYVTRPTSPQEQAMARERVLQGIIFLDATYGPEWREKINWDKLDIIDSEKCILGQLEGSFGSARRKLNLSSKDAISYGFLATMFNFRQFMLLNRTWREIARL